MPEPTNPNTKRRHKDAVKEFNKLSSKTKTFGKTKVRVHGNDYCIAAAAHKFYLEPNSFRNILFSCKY